jgi:hypothetical protein
MKKRPSQNSASSTLAHLTLLLCGIYWTYDITILISISSETILVVRRKTPRVITTETTLCKIYMQNDLTARLNIRVVHLLLHTKTRIKIL